MSVGELAPWVGLGFILMVQALAIAYWGGQTVSRIKHLEALNKKSAETLSTHVAAANEALKQQAAAIAYLRGRINGE